MVGASRRRRTTFTQSRGCEQMKSNFYTTQAAHTGTEAQLPSAGLCGLGSLSQGRERARAADWSAADASSLVLLAALLRVRRNHAEARLRRRVARRRRGRLAAARHLLRQPAVPPQAERAAAGLPRHAHAGAARRDAEGRRARVPRDGRGGARGARRGGVRGAQVARQADARRQARLLRRGGGVPARVRRRAAGGGAAAAGARRLPVPAGALHARGEGRGRLRPRGLLQFSV